MSLLHCLWCWLRTLISIFITLLGIIAITFFIGRVLPIDPTLAILGDGVSQASYEAARAAMGLDLPLYQQFGMYLKNILQGDLGHSFLTQNSVLDDIRRVFPATLELATISVGLSVFLGIPLGILAAVYHNQWPDHLVRILGLIGNSFSIFWIALIGLLIFYIWSDWSAGPGLISPYYTEYTSIYGSILLHTLKQGNFDAFYNALKHIWLPAGILAYYKLALISRMTRTFLLEQLQQEYILTACAKGLSKTRILFIHTLGNSPIPLLTVIGLSYALALEGSTFIETIFLRPGLGYYLVQALRNADMNAVLGCTLVIGLILTTLNLIIDLLCHYLNPKLRTHAKQNHRWH